MTTVAAQNDRAATSASSAWQINGLPAQTRYCFGVVAPSRAPRPAATTMRETRDGKRR
jgi:hypothetical protein